MAPHNFGGKVACQKQRELRTHLLATDDEREADLTSSDFNWRAVLKSLPTGADIVGAGVCKFTFRLLSDVRDPNYIKKDSGERHVFEVTRADGSSVQLHFHKNGKCDKPEMFRKIPIEIGAAEPDRAKAKFEFATPVSFNDIVHSEASGDNLPLGRNEATMALEALLQVTRQGTQIDAVNVTDGIAFPWKRLLCNTMENKEIVAGGISAVYVVPTSNYFDGPQLFFCHPNLSYTCVFLQQKTHVVHSRGRAGWQDLPVLQNAMYFDKSWMFLRGHADRC